MRRKTKASRVPARPVVHDAARVAAAPVEFEGVVGEGPAEPRAAGVAAMPYAPHDAKQPMRHAPAEGDSCLFVIIFNGPVDVHPIDE